MEEGSVLTSNVPDVRIEDFQTVCRPRRPLRRSRQGVRRSISTEVIGRPGRTREWTESLVSTVVFVLIFTTFIAQATQVPDTFDEADDHGR